MFLCYFLRKDSKSRTKINSSPGLIRAYVRTYVRTRATTKFSRLDGLPNSIAMDAPPAGALGSRGSSASNKASNVACRAELGRFPLIIAINQRILNYLLYIQNKQPDSLVRQSFLISSDLHTAGKNNFHSNLMKISEYFNFENFSPDLLDTAKVKMFLRLMKQKYISYWQHTLQHSQKLVRIL